MANRGLMVKVFVVLLFVSSCDSASLSSDRERPNVEIGAAELAALSLDAELRPTTRLLLAIESVRSAASDTSLVSDLAIRRAFFPGQPFVGHGGPVTSASLSPLGELLLTISRDGAARVWSTAEHELLWHRGDDESPVTHALFDGGGERLFVADARGSLRLWSVSSLDEEPRELADDVEILDLGLSDTDRGVVVAALTRAPSIRLWRFDDGAVSARSVDLERGGRTIEIGQRGGRIALLTNADGVLLFDAEGLEVLQRRAVAAETTLFRLAPNEESLLCATRDGVIRQYSLTGDAEPRVVGRHDGAVTSMRFDASGRRLLTASEDRTSRVWSLDGRHSTVVHSGHRGAVTSAHFLGDDRFVVTTSCDGVVRIWSSIHGGEPLEELAGHDGPVLSSTVESSGARFVTASADGTARIWRFPAPGEPRTIWGNELGLADLAVEAGAERALAVLEDGRAVLWDLTHPDLESVTISVDDSEIAGVRWPPASATSQSRMTRFLSLSRNGQVFLWSRNGRGEASSRRLCERCSDGRFSSDGSMVILEEPGGLVRVLSVESETDTAELEGDIVDVRSAPGGRRALEFQGQLVTIRALASGEIIATLRHRGEVQRARFIDNGSRVISSDQSGRVTLWRLSDDSIERVFLHDAPVTMIEVSSSEAWLATVSSDRRGVSIWSLGGEATTATGVIRLGDEVTAIAFDHSGARLVTATSEGEVMTWSTTGERVPPYFEQHRDRVRDVVWSADDERVVTITATRILRQRVVSSRHLAAEACAVVGRNLSEAEWYRYFGRRPYRRTCEQWSRERH